jgi:phage terminase large subunit-like protein
MMWRGRCFRGPCWRRRGWGTVEDELAGLTYCGGYEGPGNSHDRADAMVWAMSELARPDRAMPRITRL